MVGTVPDRPVCMAVPVVTGQDPLEGGQKIGFGS